ncbi:MAG TPA: hypothetical protein ENH02_07570 [Bacteroidetes bacterium]|nr:hypothetical protein [Bacteroidota bacterium]
MNRFVKFIFLLFVIAGCRPGVSGDKGVVVARVYDDYLYESDLRGVVPGNISTLDSIAFVKNYTDQWIKTRLMIRQAEKNLTGRQLNFDKQLEDYKNSLIIYQYETELVRQKLDTVVTDEEIEKYYQEHLSDFELKENIVKVQYVIIDKQPELEDRFTALFKLPDSLMTDSLEFYGKRYAKSYFLDTAYWFRFDDLLTIIPIETYNQELFLKGHRFIRLSDGRFVYLLKFVSFRIKNDISPLDFKRNDIRDIIINKKKVALIKNLRTDIYKQAILNKDFEVYYNE